MSALQPVTYSAATVRGSLRRMLPMAAVFGAALVYGLVSAEGAATFIGGAGVLVSAAIIVIALVTRRQLDITLHEDVLDVGGTRIPWAQITRIEAGSTRTDAEALPWLFLAVAPPVPEIKSAMQRRTASMLTDWADIAVSAADLPVTPAELQRQLEERIAAARG